MSASVEYYYFVLLGATEELFFRALRHAFHHHFEHLAYILGVAFGRELVLKLDDFVQTTDFHFFWNVIRQMLRRISARAFRILEHESRIVTTFTHQREGFLMVFLCFRVIAAEDVGTQTAIRDDATDSPDSCRCTI